MTSPVGAGDAVKLVSSRTLAELARSGFSVMRGPTPRLAFEVHHVNDRPGYLRNLLEQATPPPFIETLTSAAHGIGLVIGTYMVEDMPDARVPHDSASRPLMRDDPARGTRWFCGTVAPNVGFVYDSARLFEGLISIDTGSTRMRHHHAVAIRRVAEHVANVAVNVANAPILSLQSPVQLPIDKFTDADRQPRHADLASSSALAVRFSIALTQPTAKLRIAMTERLIDFCAKNGFGLWLADSRPGHRSGNWFSICRHQATTVTGVARGQGFPDNKIEISLPVTLVGPARIGSTQAVLAYLSQYPDIGIRACSLTAIGDIAFIHLQLCAAPSSDLDIDELNRQLDEHWAGDDPPSLPHRISPPSLLPRILPHLTPPNSRGLDRLSLLTLRAGDYATLVGPAMPVRPDLADGRKALWVSWEVEGSTTELKVPFIALHNALAGRGLYQEAASALSNPNIEYLVCRRTRGSVLRCKGKISILPESFRHADLNALINDIESAWRAGLPAGSPVRELTVSWREYWLGHWTGLLD